MSRRKITRSRPLPAHGEFSLRIDGRILVTEIRGPWNTELVHLWAKAALKPSEEMHKLGAWGNISIVSESMLSTPEALEELRKVANYGVQNSGFIAQAYVATPDVLGRGIVEAVFARVYEGLCPCIFFDDYESAKAWLNALIEDNERASSAE
jgi:hypothetical protein